MVVPDRVIFLLEADKKTDDQIQQFENDLIYKNRFSSKSAVIDEIHNHEKEATIIVPSGKTYFRARIFKDFSIDKLVKYYLQELGNTDEQIKEILKTWDKTQKANALSNAQFFAGNNNLQNYSAEQIAIRNAQLKWRKSVKFKGYGSRDSSAPEPNKVTNGRANPDHIRYLYLCEDNVTPVYEIRPIIGEQVSIAKFILQKDIKVYDLTLDIQDHKDPEYDWPSLYNTIGQMFSKPYNGEAKQYIPTQFLAEKIKQMGFDGLRFNSSLHKGGVNVVLFNPNLCKAISSELVDVTDIKLSIAEPIIYKIGKKDPGE